MTWFWLRLLDLLKPVYKAQGVDFDQLRAIVGVKLEMDNRRTPAFKMQQQKEHSYAFVLILFMYSIFGAFLAAMIAYVPSVVFSFTIYHSYLMVMVTLTLISDFSAILLDTSDNTIILPRPITPKTFYAARTTHILIYIGQIGLGLGLIPIIATFFVYGAAVGATLIATSILTIVFAVSITNGLYLLIMRFTSEEKLKSIINYFQIGMAIFMMGGYQILPRVMNFTKLDQVTNTLEWWSVFIPPMWMTGMVKLVKEIDFGWIEMATTFLAIVVPLASWKAINKYLTPFFTSKLADLGMSTTTSAADSSSGSKKSFGLTLGKWITRSQLELATFTLVTYAFARDRKLKLKIYPAVGVFLIIAVLFMVKGNSQNDLPLTEYLSQLQGTEKHLFAIYLSIYVLNAATFEIPYTDEFKSSWIYLSAPIKKPGEIITGTLKAILVKFFLPLYGVMSILVLLIWKEKAVVDLLFGASACVLILIVMSIIGDKHLPLSMAPTARNQGGSFARAMITLIMIAIISAGHYFLTKVDLLLWIALPLVLIASHFILRLYRNLEWEEIKI